MKVTSEKPEDPHARAAKKIDRRQERSETTSLKRTAVGDERFLVERGFDEPPQGNHGLNS
jgi:hypothetical protein